MHDLLLFFTLTFRTELAFINFINRERTTNPGRETCRGFSFLHCFQCVLYPITPPVGGTNSQKPPRPALSC